MCSIFRIHFAMAEKMETMVLCASPIATGRRSRHQDSGGYDQRNGHAPPRPASLNCAYMWVWLDGAAYPQPLSIHR